MKLFTSITIAFILALSLSVVPAVASPPAGVTIISEMSLSGYGTFTASGSAVDAGIICPSGEVYDSLNSAVGWESEQVLVLFVHKHFVCNNGSGSFEMDLNVHIAPSGTTAQWIVVSGEGTYMHLSGNGSLFATAVDENNLIDTYSGKLNIVPAVAYAPAEVTIVSPMSAWTGYGTFNASGPAVDIGIICPSGEVYDSLNSAVGWQSGQVLLLFVHKHFVCNNGSGSFEMDLNVRIAPTGTTAQWIIVSGDGNYEHLLGNGSLYATGVDEEFLIDTYSGLLHIK